MPNKKGVLTPQERAFTQAYADTADAQYSGAIAGYSQPDAQSYTVLARPKIQAEIVRIQQERMTNELLPLALDAIHRLLTDKKTPAGAQVQAAKLVMDRSFGVQDASDKAKQPHEMTGDELARQLDRLRHEAAVRSGKIIDVTPEPAKAEPDIFA